MKTNLTICINLFLQKQKFDQIELSNCRIYYDTPFATKTFFAAVYDLYVVTQRGRILDKKPVIVDIGANIGQFLFACKTFFPGAKIYSFEPDPQIYQLLQKNASQYKNVVTYMCALASKDKSVTFYKNSVYSEWSSLVKPQDEHFTETKINAIKGDHALKNIGRIDLLKIDVEGAEYEVIKGLSKTIRRTKYLLIEVSLDRATEEGATSQMLAYLFSNSFTLFRIGRLFTLKPGEKQVAVDILLYNTKYE